MMYIFNTKRTSSPQFRLIEFIFLEDDFILCNKWKSEYFYLEIVETLKNIFHS